MMHFWRTREKVETQITLSPTLVVVIKADQELMLPPIHQDVAAAL